LIIFYFFVKHITQNKMNNNLVKPQVTVIIPTYNHAKYLGNALQSVFDQD
jgi:cellulose synthase/poly-beta-1,6-N-acetylglucosamine synthase-like glycosyltransferase